VYGAQWRNFNGIDQLKQLVYSISTNPNSRRLMVSAWNPGQMPFMVLPPCHYAFQVYINNGVMDLMWQQRSADVFLGLPYDITMYGLLLEMLAKGANLKPGKLIGQLGDCHLYNNHLEQAKVYLDRPKRVLPKLDLKEGIWFDTVIEKIHIPTADKIKLLKYNPLPAIKAELSVGN
jgi:thymidylate synthase